jgi:hypothetical protein
VKEPTVITETLPTPVFGRDGEPCPACSSPLAGDQRYCLHCGARRPEARLEFLDVLDADVRARSAPPAALVPVASAPAAVGWNARLQANSGALALGAVLLLTLLVGLLVGHWVTGDGPVAASAPAAPQVIRVEGAAAPSAAAPDTTAAAATAGAGAASAAHKSKSSKKSAAAKASSGSAPKGAVSVKQVAGDKKAIDKAIKKGKPIATGGTPPPKDNKPAGGGSSFETIG